jgi:hypothetical protein
VTSFEDPETSQERHPTEGMAFRLTELPWRQGGFPLEEAEVIDLPQGREKPTSSSASGIEAKGSIEIDNEDLPGRADEDVVPLAKVDVHDPSGVDRLDEAPEAREKLGRQLTPSPMGDSLPLHVFDRHGIFPDSAEITWNPLDAG